MRLQAVIIIRTVACAGKFYWLPPDKENTMYVVVPTISITIHVIVFTSAKGTICLSCTGQFRGFWLAPKCDSRLYA